MSEVERKRRPLHRGASLLAAALVLTAAPAARADEKQACIQAFERAQQLRNAGKLTQARDQLNVCGRPECPKLIQQDCSQWMSDVLAIVPSVVPGAKDRRGRDIVDVRVLVDGVVATEKLDGKPIVVDPGERVFRFETKGAPAIEEHVVVRQGEKNRILTVTFAMGDDIAASIGDRPSVGETRSEPPIGAFVAGGLGIVALGFAGYFGLSSNADARNLRDTCAPSCAQSDVDDVQKQRTIGFVSAGIGGALLVTGVVWLVVHAQGSSAPSSRTALGNVFRF